jgi:hypothetical protein
LKQIHRQATAELDALSAGDYAQQRAAYIRAGHGVPAAGAVPLPDVESGGGGGQAGFEGLESSS